MSSSFKTSSHITESERVVGHLRAPENFLPGSRGPEAGGLPDLSEFRQQLVLVPLEVINKLLGPHSEGGSRRQQPECEPAQRDGPRFRRVPLRSSPRRI